jgi:hypothetical protein
MIDLEAIKSRILYQQSGPMPQLHLIHEADLNTLVAEVERLNDLIAETNAASADTAMRWAQESREAYRQRDAATIDERAAVVAFLRETLATSETAYASDDLDYAIAVIERGAHRKESE